MANVLITGASSGFGKMTATSLLQRGHTVVAQALESAGGLDVVVNNAGLGVIGVQETFTSEDWRRS